jgi:hypothetical protein
MFRETCTVHVLQVFSGFLLSIVFVQSHNGMEVYCDTKDFVTAQIVSTRDITAGLWNDWFTGTKCMGWCSASCGLQQKSPWKHVWMGTQRRTHLVVLLKPFSISRSVNNGFAAGVRMCPSPPS